MISVSDLIHSIKLAQISHKEFKTKSIAETQKRVFGGLLVAQATYAIGKICLDKFIHSLHVSFLNPANPFYEITYSVETLKKGQHFDSYQCKAYQNEKIILSLTASFHNNEHGFEHSHVMPKISFNDTCNDSINPNIPTEIQSDVLYYLKNQRPFIICPSDSNLFSHQSNLLNKDQPIAIWFKAKDIIPDDQLLQTSILAYLSDMSLLNAALPQHNSSIFDKGLQIASIDHSIWFHETPNMNNWILYVQNSPWAGQGRALCHGSIYSQSGALLATTAQEGLIRFKI